jgi:CRP/FNR family transcriptional regulator, cyclic AMP receptor protein
METNALGSIFEDGETIIRQGDYGDCMYVIQEGQVEIIRELDDNRVRLAVRHKGDFFGEMAIFEHEVRSATVRALGNARVLTIDKKNFMRRIHEDPSLAYRMVQTMSRRIRELSVEVTQLRTTLGEYPNQFEVRAGSDLKGLGNGY